MPSIENAVIAVAGKGTRLGARKPKCLVEVCGKTIAEYQLELLENVKNIYMVVGFCENEVIDHVSAIRKDVIFVRNPGFQHNKTLASYHLAANVIDGSAVFMDGDMIISPADFSRFLNQAAKHEILVGVSERITDDPVYADITRTGDELTINGFSYEKRSSYEWANVVYMPANLMKDGTCNAFEYIQTLLPAPAATLDRLEIDTKADLEYAKKELAELDWKIRVEI